MGTLNLTLDKCLVPQLELKKMLLDRMVHLLSRGSAIPVVTYVRKCSEQQDTDISLIRHFVTEVGEICCCWALGW